MPLPRNNGVLGVRLALSDSQPRVRPALPASANLEPEGWAWACHGTPRTDNVDAGNRLRSSQPAMCGTLETMRNGHGSALVPRGNAPQCKHFRSCNMSRCISSSLKSRSVVPWLCRTSPASTPVLCQNTTMRTLHHQSAFERSI